VVRNVGPLLTLAPLDGDIISNRGFNALVFAPGAGPSHFLKVRPKRHEAFLREAEITVRLSEHPGARALVPRSRAFSDGPAHVLAEDFVNGLALDVLIRSRHARPWHVLAADVLHSAAALWDAIREVSRSSDASFVDASPLLEDLELLESLGLDSVASGKLGSRLRAVRLPSTPQHGDFWPRNVMRTQGGWQVLDFETCGEVVIPLYDIFHFVRGCGEAASRDQGSWISSWVAAGSTVQPLINSVQRAARGLDSSSVEAALVAYLVEFAARLHRRGVARPRIAGRLRELNALPDLLDRGVVQRLLG